MNIIYKMSLLIAFISFTGVEMTQAMDEKKDEFKEVNLGKGSPKSSPREEKGNNTDENETSSNKPKQGDTTTPPKTDEKKKSGCTIL